MTAARLRATRTALGLSQLQLAEQAGVTRQLVSAIESDRHRPSVDAALRLAGALGTSVESLFGAVSPVDLTIGDPVAGSPVVHGVVGPRRVAAPVRHLLSSEAWALADGFAAEGGVDWLDDIDPSGLLVAGCDPLLGLAAALLERRRGPRVLTVQLSTGAAVDALRNGLAHAVVVHGRLGDLPVPPVPVRRWAFASWQVGLASAVTRTLGSVEELAERRLRTAQRDNGAGTQGALLRALASVGAGRVPGPTVDGHLDAVRHVVAGVPVGVTMEPAARAYGLGFLPLETHHSELWVDERHVEHRSAVALVSLLTDAALVRRAARLPGYDVADMGCERVAS